MPEMRNFSRKELPLLAMTEAKIVQIRYFATAHLNIFLCRDLILGMQPNQLFVQRWGKRHGVGFAILLGVMVLGLLGISGCKASTKAPQELNLRLSAEPGVLNPILSTDAPSGEVIGLIFNGLFRVNDALELEPDLCERYDVDSAGTVYTFYLRQDVKWHDGAPFTADDVLFTFNTILDPKTNTVRRSSFIIDGAPVQFEKVDSYTVKAILPKPFAPFLVRISMEIIPKHLLGTSGDINTDSFNRRPVGTGPFVFSEWKDGQYVRLIRNDQYFRGAPKLDSIVMKIIPDSNTALLALENHEIHSTGIQPGDVDKIKANSDFRLIQYQQLQYSYLGLNLKRAPLNEPLVRQAIAHAINKPAIVDSVLKGFAKPAIVPASPVSWSYPDGIQELYEYNPGKSRTLLESVGFKFDSHDGLYFRNGHPLGFKLFVPQGNKTSQKVAQVIQQFLKEVGIDVSIQTMEWQSFLSILDSPELPKKFDMVMLGWSLSIDPDSYSIWHSSQYPKGFNFVGYSNPYVDRLLSDGRTTIDPVKRKVIYSDLVTEIAKELPYVFLFYPDTLTAVDVHVKGLSQPGPAGLFNHIENVYLAP